MTKRFNEYLQHLYHLKSKNILGQFFLPESFILDHGYDINAFTELDGTSLVDHDFRVVDLNDWYFYLSFDQLGGPSILPSEITINGIAVEPIILLRGSDATTTGWVNRGTLGGTLTAVNMRDEDMGWETPFTDDSKAVRFHSIAGGTRRYYSAPDTTWGDFDTEDMYWEAVFSRDMPITTTSVADAIVFTKRNESSSAAIGYTMYAASSTTFAYVGRPVSDAKRTNTSTITARSWYHQSGFLDSSETTGEGMHQMTGSQSSSNQVHGVGSLTNLLIATIGDAPNWGSPNAAEVNFKLVYLAIYKRSDWLPGGTTNNTEVSTLIRKRQMVLAGMVPQKGTKTPLTSTWSYRQSQRIINGLAYNFSCGTGFACPYESILPSTGLSVKCQEFHSATPNLALTETFAGFVHTNTTAAANLIDLPQNPTQGLVGQGISLTGAAGTAIKTSGTTVVAASTVARRCFWQIYFKGNTAPYFYFGCPDSTSGSNRHAWYNCTTGEATLGAGAFAVKVQACQDGWFRAQLTFQVAGVGVAVPTDMVFGFSDTNTSFDLTSDGTTIDGWTWGIYYTFTTSAVNTYPAQFFPYSAGTANATGPLIVFDGADVTAAPYSLWAEFFSRDRNANASGALAVLLSYTTDATNFNQLYINRSNVLQQFVVDGGIGGTFHWNISGLPTSTEGSINASSGSLLAQVSSCATNDIKLYGSNGVLLGSDALATIPTGQTNIRIGNTVAGTVSSRGYQWTRVGIKSVTSTGPGGPS